MSIYRSQNIPIQGLLPIGSQKIHWKSYFVQNLQIQILNCFYLKILFLRRVGPQKKKIYINKFYHQYTTRQILQSCPKYS